MIAAMRTDLATADDFERPMDTALLDAVLEGDLAAIDAAISATPTDFVVRSHFYGCSALELSLDLGRLDITELLLSKGADPNDGTADFSALSYALSLPAELRAPAVALLARYGVKVRSLDRETARELDADPSLLDGLPASSGELDEIDDAPLPVDTRPRSDAWKPTPPPPEPPVSDAQLTLWMLGWAMALIAAFVAIVALLEWAGWL
jgi:hypothetical protein